MTEEEQALARLSMYIAHAIEHGRDHIREVEQQVTHIDNPEIVASLKTAVCDIVAASHSLEVALTLLNNAVPGHHSHGHDDHGHDHHGHDHHHGISSSPLV